MFFESDEFAVRFLNAMEFDTEQEQFCVNEERPYYALSYRFTAETVLTDGSGRSWELGDGSIAYVPAGVWYTRAARHERMIVLHFQAYGDPGRDINVLHPRDARGIEQSFEEVLRLYTEREPGYLFRCGECLNRLLYRIEREYALDVPPSTAQHAARLIEREAARADFSVDELVGAFACSGAQLRKLFRQEYGVSPKQYLTRVRMDSARARLQAGLFSVRQVAERCGYANEKYFATAFKAYTGLTPSQYAAGRT